MPLPYRHHCREFLPPWALCKRLERNGQSFALLPVRPVQRITDQVYDASLELGRWVDRLDRFRETAQVVDYGDQDVGQPTVCAN